MSDPLSNENKTKSRLMPTRKIYSKIMEEKITAKNEAY